jgi:hypothetical protein
MVDIDAPSIGHVREQVKGFDILPIKMLRDSRSCTWCVRM